MDASRYSCQVALPGFGGQAQQRLQQAKVLIVGMGGLGCPAAQYLAASGVGTLGIADDDTITISNLHRQILYTPADAGLKKVTVAAQKLQAQNPEISIIQHILKVTADNVMALFGQYDMILDGTDNFETRYLLNDAAVLSGKPLIYGAIYQYEGQVAVWNAPNTDGTRSPNYRDLYPQIDATQIPNCADGGVIPTIAGIIGCAMANETIKYITQTGELLAGRIMIMDALTMQSKVIKIGSITKTNITQLPQTVTAETINAIDLKAALETGTIELIDIRGSEEHEDFNIGGRHIPAYKLERALDSLDAAKTIVLYCTIGKRSADAVKRMKALKPDLNMVSLEGGVKAWVELE